MLSPLSCLEFTTLCPYILFQNYYSVQIVLTEHVSSTTESNEFELILINAFLNQCVVNSLSTFSDNFWFQEALPVALSA